MSDPSILKTAMLESGVNPLFVPSRFVAVGAIPKLGTGKKDLAGAKALALEYSAG
jgi:acyl-[acyl-carrier-protein]-phospholipid O-acyltransferase/long-chain-fatty-acid--[acyl-carrier-protein] ligase